MQETAKVYYIQYGKSTKNKEGKKSQHFTPSTGSDRGSRGHGIQSKLSGKGRKVSLPPGTCYRCGKGRHQKDTECKALEAICQGWGWGWGTPGAGVDDQGQPIFSTHMVSVLHSNKHLIKFPIALDYLRLRRRNKMANSTDSTGCAKCSTVLLKADAGADVNLMNIQTFDSVW